MTYPDSPPKAVTAAEIENLLHEVPATGRARHRQPYSATYDVWRQLCANLYDYREPKHRQEARA